MHDTASSSARFTDPHPIRTKITLPRCPENLLPRPRLRSLLDAALEHRLTLVTAPAGYGKSAALVDWAHQTDVPVCWYGLDESDTDPWQFLTYLTGAMAQCIPTFGAVSRAVLENSGIELDAETLARVIACEVSDRARAAFVLVLDDYHLVGDSGFIARFLSAFVQYVDETCHLILTCREHVDLPDLVLLTARSQTTGLSQEELAFTVEEIQALFQCNYKMTVSDELAAELIEVSEGWITGLLLATPAPGFEMVDRIRAARAAGVGLHDYLAQQVLDRQPEDIRAFLLRSALLGDFDAQLCAQTLVMDAVEVSSLMQSIQQRCLFVSPADSEGACLRYHRLFLTFLQSTMRRESPEEYVRILRRLAEACIRDRLWSRAYAVYRRLDDLDGTVELTERAGSWMIRHGQLALLSEWLQALSGRTLRSHPKLISLQGVVASAAGDFEGGLALQSEALGLLRAQHQEQLTGGCLARVLLRRAADLRALARYQEALRDVETVLEFVERCVDHADRIAGEALRTKGAILTALGYPVPATWWLERSLSVYTTLDDTSMVALVLMELGVTASYRGHFSRARRFYEQSLDAWQQLENVLRQSTVLNNLGVLCAATGDYIQAAESLSQGLTAARQTGYVYSETLILASTGDLYTALGALEAAADAYAQAFRLAVDSGDRFVQLYVRVAQAELSRRQGELSRGRYYLADARRLLGAGSSSCAVGLWHLGAGRQALSEGEMAEAVTSLETATQQFDAASLRAESDLARLYLAAAYCSIGERRNAIKTVARALDRIDRSELSHVCLTVERDIVKQLRNLIDTPSIGPTVEQLTTDIARWYQQIPEIRRRLRHQSLELPLTKPRIVLRALGGAEVVVDGTPVPANGWIRQTSRDLLYCLLAHPEGLSKEEIGVIFWPDSAPAQLNELFKKTIWGLRRVLGSGAVIHEQGHYRFNAAEDYSYDVELFWAKLAQAHRQRDPDEAVELLCQALAVYRGAYLPESEWNWVAIDRERLCRAFSSATQKVATYHLERADPESALACCQRLLREDSGDEPAHRLMMQAYAAMGDQGAMARQYRRCCQVLADDLDVMPSVETLALYNRLRQRDLSGAHRRAT